MEFTDIGQKAPDPILDQPFELGLRDRSLIPRRDPRLGESLAFENY